MKANSSPTLIQRLDSLYEFDREPVPGDKLQGPANFIGIFAGEHVAGTEFIIGPLFVPSFLVFSRQLSRQSHFDLMLAGTVLWFVTAGFRMIKRNAHEEEES